MVVGGELQENLNAHIAGGIHDPDAYHFGYVGRDEYLEISATLTFTLTVLSFAHISLARMSATKTLLSLATPISQGAEAASQIVFIFASTTQNDI